MPESSTHLYLLHIRDCCQQLLKCAALRDAGEAPDSILLDAACRNLEIIGEASRKVGEEFRRSHPEIPWRQMNDLRNVLIHNYDGADPAMIWGIVDREIPALLRSINGLIGLQS